MSDFSDSDENSAYSNTKKDRDEEKLEELVFGNSLGIPESKFEPEKRLIDQSIQENSDEVNDKELTGLSHIDDHELFFLDCGPSREGGKKDATDLSFSFPESHAEPTDVPAWIDSDDDRLAISLATNTRLRKLRVNENEDIVSGQEYIRRLQRQYERLNPPPPWVQTPSRPYKRRRRSSATSEESTFSENEDEQFQIQPLSDILQKADSLTKLPDSIRRAKLRPEVLDIQQTRPLQSNQLSAIHSLSFHPKLPIILSSGLGSTLFLHRIDPTAHPTPNPLLTSVYVKRTPLYTSSFLYPKGYKIVFSGRRKYFHIWDLKSGNVEKVTRVYGHNDEQKFMDKIKPSPCGRYLALQATSKKKGGIINILDANTTQWVSSMRIEGAQGICDFSWWRNGNGLTVISKTGEVAEWSVNERAYVARWIDDGFAPTVLTLGGSNGPQALGGDRWVVIGSQSGIVNIYDRRTFVSTNDPSKITISERPQPKKSFDQLTRPISQLAISPDGQLLSFSSQWKKDALRLVHLASCTVYRNWPTDRTPFGRITAVAFSNESNLLAVGNDSGKIHMWEIRS